MSTTKDNAQIIGELRSIIIESQKIIKEQADALDEITAPPKKIGIILYNTDLPKLHIGDRVVVNKKSGYQHQAISPDNPKGFGTVIEMHSGEHNTVVKWDHDERNAYRYHPKYHPKHSMIDIYKLDYNEEAIIRRVMVATENSSLLINLADKSSPELAAGDWVELTQNGAIISKLDIGYNQMYGELATISNITKIADEKDIIEVDINGSIKKVLYSDKLDTKKLKKNDKVLLDKSASIIIEYYGTTQSENVVKDVTKTTWDDIGGQKDSILAIREAIELPQKYNKLFNHYKKRGTKGIALYGPPGCGKTMLGKAIVSSLQQMHGKESTDTGFIYVKGPELLNKYVGNTESHIRNLFNRANSHYTENGYPAVLFIDEADALLGKRGSDSISHMSSTIVPMFLAEMDGISESRAIVIISTNRIDVIDPAILREGRIDVKIKVSRPDKITALDIFNLYLKHIPLNNGYSYTELANVAITKIFDEKKPLYKVQTKKEERILSFSDILSGATIAGIVERATSLALHRDINKNSKKPSGLKIEDLETAIENMYIGQHDLNHDDDILNLIDDIRKEDVLSIIKVK